MRTSIVAFLLASFLHAAQPTPTNHGAVGAGEGPVADRYANLYFTAADRISKRDPSGKITIYREPSGGANGLIFDLQGRLIVCESNNRRVTRIEPNGQITILTDQYESKKYNSPNDLSIDTKGRIYFSDPRYGARDTMEMSDGKGRFFEGVYRIDAPGKVSRVIGHEVERANGVFVSPGDKYLYVADNNNNVIGGARKLWRFALRPDGFIVPGTRQLIFDWQDGRGPDGLKMDRNGLLYVAAGRNDSNKYESAAKHKGGIYVLSPEGKLLNFIAIPKDEVTNCAFGNSDWKTLFITAGGTLWSIAVDTAGWIPYIRP